MDSFTYDKQEILKIVRENRDQHQQIFDEAVEGYKTRVIAELERHLADVKAGRRIYISVAMPKPENHLKDYERVIRMIELSTEDTVEMSEHDFAQYVQDDWAWKRAFLTSNSTYSGTAATTLAADYE